MHGKEADRKSGAQNTCCIQQAVSTAGVVQWRKRTKGSVTSIIDQKQLGPLPSGLTVGPHPELWVPDEPLPSLSLTRHFYIMG